MPFWVLTVISVSSFLFFFFFNDTATTEIYTLSLHDALPISPFAFRCSIAVLTCSGVTVGKGRSEEHTSELQSQSNLVCRLLLEKTKTNNRIREMVPPDSRYTMSEQSRAVQ